MTGGYKSHVTDSVDFGNFRFGGHSYGKIYVSHCSQKENIWRSTACAVFKSKRNRGNGTNPFFQHDHKLYDKYKPAALLRRVRTFLFESDAGNYFYDVYLRSFRLCGLYGILPGTCRKEKGFGELL